MPDGLVLDVLWSCCQNQFLRLTFKTAQCEINAPVFWDGAILKRLLYMISCGLLDDKLINLSVLWKVTLLLIKRERLVVARRNKITLFFKTGCPRAVPLQGFSVSKNPDPSPCHKVLFVNKTYNPNLTSCGLACIVQDRRVCLWLWWEGPCLRSTAITCSHLRWINHICLNIFTIQRNWTIVIM